MKASFFVITLLFFGALAGTSVHSQSAQPTSSTQAVDPAISSTSVYGKVTEIKGAAGEVTVKTDAGSIVVVKLSEKTTYERMPAGETDRT